MSDFAGRLRIALAWTGERWRVAIHSSRPVAASRVFVGKSLDKAARQIPLLYSLCATAQSQAFVAAAERVLGIAPDPETQGCRQQLLQAELIKEHLWRLLLDWPPLLDLPREDARMARIIQAYQRLRTQQRAATDPFIPGARISSAITSAVTSALSELVTQAQHASLAMHATDWLVQCHTIDGWQQWTQNAPAPTAALIRALQRQSPPQLGHAETAFLTPLVLTALEERLSGNDAESFIAAPDLGGHCHETTPLARMAEHPLIAELIQVHGSGVETRLAALLLELAQALADLTSVSPATGASPPALTDHPAPDIGLAAVAAARGLLVHRLVVRDGRIERHQVLAPTEWNFHPRGILHEALSQLPPPDRRHDQTELERLTRLMVTAIDPCVDYSVTLQDNG